MRYDIRPCLTDDDYWRARQFLRDAYLANGRRDRCWQTYRLDYWRWHGLENILRRPLQEFLFLCEAEGGRLVALLSAEDKGDAFLNVHPAYLSEALDRKLIHAAAELLPAETPDGGHTLNVWCRADDPGRQALLRELGYARGDWPEHQRYRPMSLPIPDVSVPAGYVVRALGDTAADPVELERRSWVSWRAFHPDAPDDQYARDGGAWYRNIQRAPLYRRDLDLVIGAPDGAHAAFATVWFDDVTRSGAFEPVGVAPEHQRRGLATAVMNEALRRLRHLGATQATVGGYSIPANGLYASVGFTDFDLQERWVKAW